jgi:hypothetical protein
MLGKIFCFLAHLFLLLMSLLSYPQLILWLIQMLNQVICCYLADCPLELRKASKYDMNLLVKNGCNSTGSVFIMVSFCVSPDGT